MITVKVWYLPCDESEEDMNHLHQTIVSAVKCFRELGIKNENDMLCLFVPDLMTYGLGDEILVEIDGVGDIEEGNSKTRIELATRVGRSVSTLYPDAEVKCVVKSFDPSEEEWSSK